jgi:hypothetical protein
VIVIGVSPCPVNLRETRSKRSERGFAIFDVHRSAAIDDALELRELRIRQRRTSENSFHHRRCGKHQRAIPRPNQREYLAGIEGAGFRNDIDGASRNMRQRIETGAVRQRCAVKNGVTRRNAFYVGQKTVDHRVKIAVRDDDAFGPSRRPAGVEEPRGSGRLDAGDRRNIGIDKQPLVFR